jgi:ADP-ribosyl-[dinitrogen reductase] hydrolase
VRDDVLDRSRFRGALLGLAAGDAVGTAVEFSLPGAFTPLTDMVGGGVFGLRPGEWTDDTSMALCLAESLVETGGFDPVDQLDRYVAWWKEGHLSSTGRCFDIGTTTRAVLGDYLRTGAFEPPLDDDSAANGSIMRLAPVPLRYAGDMGRAVAFSRRSSRTTHPAARPVDCCRLLGSLIAGAVRGVPKAVLLAPDWWRFGDLHPAVAAVAAGSYAGKAPPDIRGDGYCVASLEAALWALATTDTFRDGVLAAANLGEDADTTAAVYGQLAGALYGEEGIPAAWRERLALSGEIVAFADRLHAAAYLPDHYRVEDRLLAGEYPGRPEALAALAAFGVSAYVDLTGEGELPPYAELLGDGVAHHRRAVADLGVPTSDGLAGTLALVDDLLAGGETVYVHCRFGIGRTGTLIAARLARQLGDPDAALARLAVLRRASVLHAEASPETAAQRALVRRAAG